jgi:hypothetical protein
VRTYYRGPYAVVTDLAFETWTPTYRRFAIADLHAVDVAVTGPPTGAAVLLPMTAGVLLAGAAGWWTVGPVWAAALGVPVALASTVTAAALARPGRRTWTLTGWYRGGYVDLFESTDEVAFGHVSRALRRAIEHHEEFGRPRGG